MKNNRVKVLLVALCILWGLNIRYTPISFYSNSFLPLLVNIMELLSYSAMLLICVLLYKLIGIYKRLGFFDLNSIKLVETMGLGIFSMAAFSVVSRTLTECINHPDMSVFSLTKVIFSEIVFYSSSKTQSIISPGLQSRAIHIFSKVPKRTPLALPVFRMERFTFDTPTRSASSFSDIFRLAIITSKFITMGIFI